MAHLVHTHPSFSSSFVPHRAIRCPSLPLSDSKTAPNMWRKPMPVRDGARLVSGYNVASAR